MATRVIVALLGIPVIFLILFWAPPIWLPVAIAILSMIAVHEVLWSTGFVKNAWISGLSLILAGVIPFWVYSGEGMAPALLGIFAYFFAIFLVAISSHYTVTMEKMGGSFFFSVLIPYFLSSFVRITAMPWGKYAVLLPMVVAFSTDTFAFFSGMAFGKHKLAPELSPKKTVEGAVGGALGALAGCVIFGAILGCFFRVPARCLSLALYGLVGSPVSQIGDLSFSYIKRQYGLKDFGNIFPGHGGVLDRFDSVIFCAPLVEILLHYFPVIG